MVRMIIYVFVRYVDNEKFEAFLEPAYRVIKDVDAAQEDERKRGLVGTCRRLLEYLRPNCDGDSFRDFIDCPLWKK